MSQGRPGFLHILLLTLKNLPRTQSFSVPRIFCRIFRCSSISCTGQLDSCTETGDQPFVCSLAICLVFYRNEIRLSGWIFRLVISCFCVNHFCERLQVYGRAEATVAKLMKHCRLPFSPTTTLTSSHYNIISAQIISQPSIILNLLVNHFLFLTGIQMLWVQIALLCTKPVLCCIHTYVELEISKNIYLRVFFSLRPSTLW